MDEQMMNVPNTEKKMAWISGIFRIFMAIYAGCGLFIYLLSVIKFGVNSLSIPSYLDILGNILVILFSVVGILKNRYLAVLFPIVYKFLLLAGIGISIYTFGRYYNYQDIIDEFILFQIIILNVLILLLGKKRGCPTILFIILEMVFFTMSICGNIVKILKQFGVYYYVYDSSFYSKSVVFLPLLENVMLDSALAAFGFFVMAERKKLLRRAGSSQGIGAPQRMAPAQGMAAPRNAVPAYTLFCPSCGKRFTDADKFCNQCGTALAKLGNNE